MYKKKPKVFITRRLPKKIETRMMELFDATLNEKDVLLTENELIKVFKNYEIKRMASKVYIGQKEWGRVEVLSQKRIRGRVIVDLSLHQGKKREIRRVMFRMKRKVFSLQRIKFGPIELGNLPIGQWRELSSTENQLLNNIKLINSSRA